MLGALLGRLWQMLLTACAGLSTGYNSEGHAIPALRVGSVPGSRSAGSGPTGARTTSPWHPSGPPRRSWRGPCVRPTPTTQRPCLDTRLEREGGRYRVSDGRTTENSGSLQNTFRNYIRAPCVRHFLHRIYRRLQSKGTRYAELGGAPLRDARGDAQGLRRGAHGRAPGGGAELQARGCWDQSIPKHYLQRCEHPNPLPKTLSTPSTHIPKRPNYFEPGRLRRSTYAVNRMVSYPLVSSTVPSLSPGFTQSLDAVRG